MSSNTSAKPADAELRLGWFAEELDRLGVDAHVFYDYDTDTRLVVCRHNPDICQRLFEQGPDRSPIRQCLPTMLSSSSGAPPKPNIDAPPRTALLTLSQMYHQSSPSQIQLDNSRTQMLPSSWSSVNVARDAGVLRQSASNTIQASSDRATATLDPVNEDDVDIESLSEGFQEQSVIQKPPSDEDTDIESVDEGFTEYRPVPRTADEESDQGSVEETQIYSNRQQAVSEKRRATSLLLENDQVVTKQRRRSTPAGKKAEKIVSAQNKVIDEWFYAATIKGALLPLARQQKLKQMAIKIAGPEAFEEWRLFLQNWHAKPRSAEQALSHPASTQILQAADQPGEVVQFCTAYRETLQADTKQKNEFIWHRLRMVRLQQLYATAETIVARDPKPLRSGQTRQAQFKRALFDVLYPQYAIITTPMNDARSRSVWQEFGRLLGYAYRWHTIKERLGYGVLGLIPSQLVSNNWIQNDLSIDEFYIWLDVIEHFNPACITAGRNRQLLLGEESAEVEDLELLGDMLLSRRLSENRLLSLS
jgi:hypothetical protein